MQWECQKHNPVIPSHVNDIEHFTSVVAVSYEQLRSVGSTVLEFILSTLSKALYAQYIFHLRLLLECETLSAAPLNWMLGQVHILF